MNRKAITGSGVTWVVATFAVLLLAIFYLIGISGLVTSKLQAGPSEISVKPELNSNLEIQKTIVFLLNKKVVYENTELTISDLILQNDLKDDQVAKIFQVHSENTFNSIFSNPNSIQYWWFRVYNKSEIPAQYPAESKFISGGTSCNPENPGESLVISQFIGDKRIIFCLNKKYYNELELSNTK